MIRQSIAVGAIGLVGLLGGCDFDKNETWIKDKCTKGDLTFKAQYVSVNGGTDSCDLLVYRDSSLLGSIEKINSARPNITCDDGKVFDAENCIFSYKPQ